jgi:hypothetical protein
VPAISDIMDESCDRIAVLKAGRFVGACRDAETTPTKDLLCVSISSASETAAIPQHLPEGAGGEKQDG